MKTCPSPPAGRTSGPLKLTVETAHAFDDALFELASDQGPKREPVGVLPIWSGGARHAPMSLGTRRLCSDLDSQAQQPTGERSITGLDGSIPVACLEWNRATFYRESLRKPGGTQLSLTSTANLTRGEFNGYMSPATRRKVRRIVTTWLRSVMIYRSDVRRKYDSGKPYPVFITVTLPCDQVHTDAEINRACLQPFLIRLRRDYEVTQYFWRAEAQENGRVHYHILLDRYIPKRYLQLAWNMSTEALGYLTRYYEQTGSLTPPSTQVQGVRTTVIDKRTGKERHVDPVNYLLDYVMDTPQVEEREKDGSNEAAKPKRLVGHWRDAKGNRQQYYTRPITGRVWGMSDGLREIREARAEATVELVQSLEEARESGELRRVDTEHATMYFGPVGLVLSRRSRRAYTLLKDYHLHVFQHLYPNTVPTEWARKNPALDPRGLWIDLDNAALYQRLKVDGGTPVFETAADLEQWMEQQKAKNERAAA
jgi:hypothetical protein